MQSMRLVLIVLLAVAVSPLEARCRPKEKSKCPNGQASLPGYFCGRGPTRQDCPSTHQCIIAPDDTYAVCCPLDDPVPTEPPKGAEKPGSCPKPNGGVGICIARCTFDSDCEGNLKCCGGCPRECVQPVLQQSIDLLA